MQHDPILKLHENKNAGEKYTHTSTNDIFGEGEERFSGDFYLIILGLDVF